MGTSDSISTPRPWTKVGVRSEKDFKIFVARTFDVLDPRNGTPYVIAVTERDELVLVRQFRFGTWGNTLEIPGGMVDGKEDVQLAAARELEEETGYRPARMTKLGDSHPNPAIFNNRLHSYLAEGCVKVHDGAPDGAEDLEVVVVPKRELPGLVRSGQITHSLVLAALYLQTLESGRQLP